MYSSSLVLFLLGSKSSGCRCTQSVHLVFINPREQLKTWLFLQPVRPVSHMHPRTGEFTHTSLGHRGWQHVKAGGSLLLPRSSGPCCYRFQALLKRVQRWFQSWGLDCSAVSTDLLSCLRSAAFPSSRAVAPTRSHCCECPSWRRNDVAVLGWGSPNFPDNLGIS